MNQDACIKVGYIVKIMHPYRCCVLYLIHLACHISVHCCEETLKLLNHNLWQHFKFKISNAWRYTFVAAGILDLKLTTYEDAAHITTKQSQALKYPTRRTLNICTINVRDAIPDKDHICVKLLIEGSWTLPHSGHERFI